jgi:D-arabinono-1,4-lactone oxidase
MKGGVMNNTSPEWQKVHSLVKIYSWITLAAVAVGFIAAHLPFITGESWSTCADCRSPLGCILAFHLYEVPLLSYNAYLAWFGLKRFSGSTVHKYSSLVSFAVTLNIAFSTFESVFLILNLKSDAPGWEAWVLALIAAILMGGSFLGMFIKQKLVGIINN